MHIEKTRGFDFDKGLTEQQKGVAWAIEKMLEDHDYWLIVHERWQDPVNFDKGPRRFFDSVPMPLRPLIVGMVRRQLTKSLHAQGLGRHTDMERAEFSTRAADALSRCLGDNPWLMGNAACGADATAYAFVSSAICPLFSGPLHDRLEAHANLVDYARRGTQKWFADLPAA